MEQDIKKLAALIVPYSFLCAVLSIDIYWGFIDINAFEFIGPQGLLIKAIPFLSYTFLALFLILLLESMFPSLKNRVVGEYTKIKTLRICIPAAILCYAMVAILALTEYGGTLQSSILISIYGGSFMILVRTVGWLGAAETVRKVFDSNLAAYAAVLVLLCAPVLVIYKASANAKKILDESDYMYIRASDLAESGKHQSDQKFIYYGSLGDYLFFRVGKSTIAFPKNSFKQIEFQRHKNIR